MNFSMHLLLCAMSTSNTLSTFSIKNTDGFFFMMCGKCKVLCFALIFKASLPDFVIKVPLHSTAAQNHKASKSALLPEQLTASSL